MTAQRLKWPLGVMGAVLALDILSKQLIQQRFQLHETLPVFPGLALTYVMNPGAAFSLLATHSATLRLPLFIGVTIAALAAIVTYFRSLPERDSLSAIALALVASGAIGNLIDRIRFGEVVDFILLDLGFWPLDPWPIFNVADSAVCIGVVLLFWRSFRPYRPSPLPPA